VVLVGSLRLLVMGMLVIVVVRMAVGQIPVGMFVLVLDDRCRGLASKTSATLAHMDLLAPAARLVTM
jgi:hypothetical protein